MFAFSLAQELGMTVAQLGRSMSLPEFVEWTVFTRLRAERQQEALAARRKPRESEDPAAGERRIKSFFQSIAA